MIELSNDNFQAEVLEEQALPVLVDFFAEWCGPCQMAGPVLDKLAQAYDGKVKFGKFDVDQESNIPGEQQVSGVPTFIIFKKGTEFKRLAGFPGEAALKTFIEEGLA